MANKKKNKSKVEKPVKEMEKENISADMANDSTAKENAEPVENTAGTNAEDAKEVNIKEQADSTDTAGAKNASKGKEKEDKKQAQIDELEDKVKRQLAEFDNYRKRTDKEKAMMFETGAKSVIEKILPVVDNFERGLASLKEEEVGTPFAEGMNMVYKQLMSELDKLEVKPIEAVGTPFDPNFHNAVMQVASEEFESGIVAQELQKGYTYRDTVVRHSMVAVVS